jgi:hypothetical protein
VAWNKGACADKDLQGKFLALVAERGLPTPFFYSFSPAKVPRQCSVYFSNRTVTFEFVAIESLNGFDIESVDWGK